MDTTMYQQQKSQVGGPGNSINSRLNSTANDHSSQGSILEEIESALCSLSPDCDYDQWIKIGMAVKNGLGEASYPLFDKWSQGGASYNAKDCQDTWKSIQPGGGITIKTLFKMARDAGWRWDQAEPRPPSMARKSFNQQLPDDMPPSFAGEKALEAAIKAQLVCNKLTQANDDHSYLKRKNVQSTSPLGEIGHEKLSAIIGYHPKGKAGSIQGKRVLVVPIYVGDKLSSLEFIDENGGKAFLAGGRLKGGYWATQSLPENDMSGLHFLVGEGITTTLSATHAVPGAVGVAAMMNSNLPSVARFLRGRYPEAQITILADIQKINGKPDKFAVEAAKAVGGKLAIPDFGPDCQEKVTDFNDLQQVAGLPAVQKQILAARQPEAEPQAVNDDPSQGTTNRRGFFLTPVNDLLLEPTTTRWLIPKILPANCLAMLVGDPAAGKSFLALDWSATLAMAFVKHFPTLSTGAVVYIAGEGHHGIKKRLKGWFLHHDVSSENVPLFVSSTGTSLDTREGLADVEAALDKVAREYGKPKLIIIDTLHRNMQGDENSSQDVGLVIKAADQIRVYYEAAVLVVHHSGHMDKSRGRGSSSLRAAVDVEILLSVKGDIRTLRCSKMKDAEPFKPLSFELLQVVLPWKDEEGNLETSAIILPTGATTKPLSNDPARLYQESPPKPKKEKSPSLSEKLGLTTLDEAMGKAETVRLEEWRECFYRKHHGDNVKTKQQAFLRVREILISKGIIRADDDMYSYVKSNPARDTQETQETNVSCLSPVCSGDIGDTTDKILKDCLVSCLHVSIGSVVDEQIEGIQEKKESDYNSFDSAVDESNYEEF